MKMTSVGAPVAVAAGRTESGTPAARTAAAAASVVAPDPGVGAQTALVQHAQAAVMAMPEVDDARVAEIKAALARGDIGFDPHKLAQLIVRHHGGRG